MIGRTVKARKAAESNFTSAPFVTLMLRVLLQNKFMINNKSFTRFFTVLQYLKLFFASDA